MSTALLENFVADAPAFRPVQRLPADPVQNLVAPLAERARVSSHLRYQPSPPFQRGGRDFVIPHFIFNGPPNGGDIVRLGLFAAIHGDEPEGAWALTALIETLLDHPELAAGYQLHIYPVCNPTGYTSSTRASSAGTDLNRAFWRRSTEPEVWWLEHELITRRFHGLVSLHSDDTAEGLYAYVRGAVFSETLARPALAAATKFLPVDRRPRIDGFAARNGLLDQCFDGVLAAPPAFLEPQPFEIIFETPQAVPASLQVQAGQSAVLAILDSYRGFLAYQASI
jgi:hypothetical protein